MAIRPKSAERCGWAPASGYGSRPAHCRTTWSRRSWRAGRSIPPPLPPLQAGRLRWALERSMHDPATMATVTGTEPAKPIHASASYHPDLAVYMEQGTADLLGGVLIDAFPGVFRDPGFNTFTRRADKRRKKLRVGTNPSRARRLVRPTASCCAPCSSRSTRQPTASIATGGLSRPSIATPKTSSCPGSTIDIRTYRPPRQRRRQGTCSRRGDPQSAGRSRQATVPHGRSCARMG